MTILTPQQIPASCDTLEKLRLWSGVVLSYLYPNLTSIEATDKAERIMQDNYYYLTSRPTPTWVNIQRSTIDLDPNWKKGPGKIWTYAKDMGTASIPPEFNA